MAGDESHRFLIHGLVGEHLHLYTTSSAFKVQVDTLANMLPLWVDALAAHAAKHDDELKAAVELAKNMPLTPLQFRDLTRRRYDDQSAATHDG